uniref:cellulase n=1 Tax=Cicer arietinum TaxID=3827 RepID=A0A3Q7YBF8_CICAR|nr:endoglucanase 24-like [Cicer arietinum]
MVQWFSMVLLSRLSFFKEKELLSSYGSGLQKYRKSAEAVICGLLPDSPTATKSRTNDGLIWVSEWNSLQHPVASAFLAAVYSDYMLTLQTPKIYFLPRVILMLSSIIVSFEEGFSFSFAEEDVGSAASISIGSAASAGAVRLPV